MKHFTNNGKEYIRKQYPNIYNHMESNKREEDIKYRQGRRKEQVEGHAMMALISILGIVVLLVIMSWLAS
jgi:hypothetical protein|tara:strand:- start:247 stop:456 length:210 start_codon:yes stop_codon:yes gene_type:complete